MTSRQCEECLQPFQINPDYPNNKMCKPCFFKNKGASEAVNAPKESIALQAIWKGLCELRSNEPYTERKSTETLIKESKLVYQELFGK